MAQELLEEERVARGSPHAALGQSRVGLQERLGQARASAGQRAEINVMSGAPPAGRATPGPRVALSPGGHDQEAGTPPP